ncbi:hypothetical protein [Sorangium sp. So ce233]|uniref:hypothetical protein n=1 Tax=Sorangium sp. So ce233 TaxID=3133290 RepID=UPI003F635326
MRGRRLAVALGAALLISAAARARAEAGTLVGSGGSGGSGSNEGPEVCRSTARGRNTPVTIHVRNTGATDLLVPDGPCNFVPWSLTSPDGGRLPSEHDVMCNGSSEVCPGICDGMGADLLAAGAETTFVWDGIVSVEAHGDTAKECPAMMEDGVCSSVCQRHVDAAPGSYTIEVRAYDIEDQGFGSVSAKTVTFNYPEQTDIDVAFPQAGGSHATASVV